MKIAIYGYGNLGKGALAACRLRGIETAVFTRRPPDSVGAPANAAVYPAEELPRYAGEFDVLLNCGASSSDLPRTTPMLLRYGSVVDSFDLHAEAEAHLKRADAAAKRYGHTAAVCIGWDPGIFSLVRAYAEAILPGASAATFWGPGVSLGHSRALRELPGVEDALQFTVPDPAAVAGFRKTGIRRPPEETHRRVCLIAAPENRQTEIMQAVQGLGAYFGGYRTEIRFVSREELGRQKALRHGGRVLFCGETAPGERQRGELRLSLDSNPGFTGAALVAYAFAAHKLYQNGRTGAFTALDIPPALLCGPENGARIRSLL